MEFIEKTAEQFLAEGEELFGSDKMKWRFVCPACGHVASVQDYKYAGATAGEIGFNCIGRRLDTCRDAFDGANEPGPCNYTGGGLIRTSPIKIGDVYYFDYDRTEK